MELLFGTHIGEHSFEPEEIIRSIQTEVIDRGMNFVTLRTGNSSIPQEDFLKWGSFLAENQIYFIFLYTIQHNDPPTCSQLTADTVARLKKIAGPYFLGDMLGETGSAFACKMPGYFVPGHCPMPPQDVADAAQAKANYLAQMKPLMEAEAAVGMEGIACVEATLLNRYNLEAGVNLPIGEIMCGNPEAMVAALRGSARAYGLPLWGTYVAHEWYGGFRHEDLLKRKRLELAYRYCYMNGTGILCLESGDGELASFGYEMPAGNEISLEARRFLDGFCAFTKQDHRPQGNPLVKIGLLQGNLDAWSGGWGGGYQWSQFSGPQWGASDAENSWNILGELGKKFNWWERDNFGPRDTAGLLPCGTFDIVPAEAPASVLKQYECLIYTGFNAMTEDQLHRMEDYVTQGGTLLMAAAHLNTDSSRSGAFRPVCGGNLEKLFGCRIGTDLISSGLGVKFRTESQVPNLLYPSTRDGICDPTYSGGYVRYAPIEPAGCTAAAALEDSFDSTNRPGTPVLVEHRLGAGHALLMTTADYPGSSAVYPLYRMLVRNLIAAFPAPVTVEAPDCLRWCMYEDGTVYLLNTDFDMPILARVRRPDGRVQTLQLEPLELQKLR